MEYNHQSSLVNKKILDSPYGLVSIAFMIEIELTPSEIMSGALIGVMRQVQNLSKKRTPAYGAGTKKDWQLHIEGALGELAVAKAMNLYYAGTGVLRADDVSGFQVRTRSKHDYELILHHEDQDDIKFVLVTGLNGKYVIRGYVMGYEGKVQEFWNDPAGGRPAFFVPQNKLHPFPLSS